MNTTTTWLLTGAAVAAAWAGFKVLQHLWHTCFVAMGGAAIAWIVGVNRWGGGVESVMLGVTVGMVLYFLSTLRSPQTLCWWCGGKSKRTDETGWNFHFCWWCGGKGFRVRLGSKMRSRYRETSE